MWIHNGVMNLHWPMHDERKVISTTKWVPPLVRENNESSQSLDGRIIPRSESDDLFGRHILSSPSIMESN